MMTHSGKLPHYDTMYIEMAEGDNKVGKFYRLSQQTLGLIERIKTASGVSSETAIIEMAVFEKAVRDGVASADQVPTAVPSASEHSEWLTTEDVAAILKVTAITVRSYAREGKLQRYKSDGRSYRFRRSDVMAMIRQVPLQSEG